MTNHHPIKSAKSSIWRGDARAVLALCIAAGLLLGLSGLLLTRARTGMTPDPPSNVADAVERLVALAHAGADEAAAAGSAAAGNQGLATVEEMIDRLAERLRRRPDDPEGWRMLGWSLHATGRFTEAVAAYREATRRSPDTASMHAALGEAMVHAGGGHVTAEARAVFERARGLDAAEPRARYYLALAKGEAGSRREQLDDWLALLADTRPDDAWAVDLEARIRELAAALGTDVSAQIAAWRATPTR